jgi:hypothetical protein
MSLERLPPLLWRFSADDYGFPFTYLWLTQHVPVKEPRKILEYHKDAQVRIQPIQTFALHARRYIGSLRSY